MNDKWMDEISLLGTGLERRWARHVGAVVEQVVNLGTSLFLNSAILGPLVNFCLHGGKTG